MKKLAIIIPAYKARFLQETLDSIAKQNSHEFTVYIGDDASPYPLKTIVDHYKNKFDIIYHRFEQNMGKKTYPVIGNDAYHCQKKNLYGFFQMTT